VPPTPQQQDRPLPTSATERPPAKTFFGRFSPLHLLHSSTDSSSGSPIFRHSDCACYCRIDLVLSFFFWLWFLSAPFNSARWLSNCKLNYLVQPRGTRPLDSQSRTSSFSMKVRPSDFRSAFQHGASTAPAGSTAGVPYSPSASSFTSHPPAFASPPTHRQ
jgi:hypothetical protein